MKLLKLKMAAFGPYSGVEEIDFEKFYGRNLFLICGDTGSGKTTIFDAICFALYGSTCGQKKEVKTLKSTFANDSQLCFVEFEFENDGKRYLIKRIPEQIVLKRSGDGLKQQKHAATLLMPDGTLKTNLKEISNLVETQIVGFDRASFNKVVMLPQGQFFKLLTERGEQQLKTFRNIFETEIYEQIVNGLFNFKQQILKDFEALKNQNLKTLNLISSDDGDFLKMRSEPVKNFNKIVAWLGEKNRFDSVSVANLEVVVQKIDSVLQNLQVKLEFCGVLNEKKKILLGVNSKLANLQKQCPNDLELSKNEIIVQKLESLNILKNSLDELDLEFKQKIVHLKQLKQELKFSENMLKNALEKFKTVDSLSERIVTLQNGIERLSVFENLIKMVLGFEKELENIDKKLKQNKLKLQVLQNEKICLTYRTEIKKEQALIFDLKKLVSYFEKKQVLQTKIKQLQSLYENEYKAFVRGQAAILAKNLKSNEPCPVCGSMHHPNKASSSIVHVVSEAKLEQSKKKFDECSANLNEVVADMSVLKSEFQFKYDLNLEVVSVLELQKIIKQHDFKIMSLRDEMLKKVPENYLNINLNLDFDYDTEIEKLNVSLNNNKSNCLMLRTKIEDILKDIPKKFHDLKVIAKFKKNNFDDKTALAKQIEDITNQKVEREKIFSGLKIKLAALQNDLKDVEQKKNRISEKLNLNLKSNGFSFEKFLNYLKKFDEIKLFLANSKKILKQIEKLKVKKQTLEYDLKQLQNLDFEKLTKLKIKKEHQKKIAKNLQISLVNTLAVNENCFKVLESSSLELQRLNEKYGAAKMLAEVAKGTRKRIGFERYIICNFINEVLAFASAYLKKATNERYIFEKLQFQNIEGLNFSVLDFYSGRVRDVSTLSGGETFVASMSLCLGLRDVISSKFLGGTMLNTMLIDEGFGTLDSKFLNGVLDCLQNLSGSNNLVGIISHVEELKNRIDFQIQVKRRVNGAGSEIQFKF